MREMQDILKLRFYFSILGLIIDNLIYCNKFQYGLAVYAKDFLVSQTFFNTLSSLILRNYATIVLFSRRVAQHKALELGSECHVQHV